MGDTVFEDDLYQLLGIAAEASAADIVRAYRKLAMAWHPDRNASHDAAEQFKRIRNAYEVLRDPHRRALYDRQAAQAARRPPAPGGNGGAARAGNLSRRCAVTLEEQIEGCRASLKLTRTEYCKRCHGSGRLDSEPRRCAACRGSGRVRRSMPFFFFGGELVECQECGGRGSVPPACPQCKGSGNGESRTGHLRFDIPAGMRPETTMRVRGYGRPGRRGQDAGDLIVRVGIEPHPLFEPDFPDLRCHMPVSAFRLLAGGSLDVPTLDGPVRVPLPEDAGEGTLLRLPGAGMLDGASGRRGDLLVRLSVVRPQALTAAQLALLDQLERALLADPAQARPLADWARRLDDAAKRRKAGRRSDAGEKV
jgi:molecular chaperone DnaJ